jgi:hypothetical protein
MGKGIETGKAYLQQVLGKITDPELKAQAEKVFASAQVQTEIGNGVEGQSEIDRRLQELTTKTTELDTKRVELDEKEGTLAKWHGDLTGWREANNALLELGKQAKAKGFNPAAPAGTPPASGEPPAGTLTEDKLKEALTAQAGDFLGFERDRQRLTREHFSKFKEILDIDPLLQHPQVRELGLAGVYALVHKEALAKLTDDTKKAEEERIRADERSKVLASNQQMPYPPVTGSNAGSPLDALKPPEGGGPLVDNAVAEYNRLQQVRNGASA